MCLCVVFIFVCLPRNTQVLRQRWPSLIAILDVFVGELGNRFSPRQEERLLAVVAALLHRCYKVGHAHTHTHTHTHTRGRAGGSAVDLDGGLYVVSIACVTNVHGYPCYAHVCVCVSVYVICTHRFPLPIRLRYPL